MPSLCPVLSAAICAASEPNCRTVMPSGPQPCWRDNSCASQLVSEPALVTLTNGSVTNFSLAYSSVSTAKTVCDNAVTISVQFAAGGASVPITPAYPIQPCDNGKIWLSPFY